MHPLASIEIVDLELLRALNRGLVPAHYLDPAYERSLRPMRGPLEEEVFDQGLTRNVAALALLRGGGLSHGDFTNYANIARDFGVDAKTVKEYYQIPIDTLLGTLRALEEATGASGHREGAEVLPLRRGRGRALTRRRILETRGDSFGRALEHFVLMESLAHRSYRGLG